MIPDDFLAAKTNPDALWDYELDDYANPEYRAAKSATCNGLCLDQMSVGLAGNAIVYAHPDCPLHGPYPKAEEPR